MVHLWSNGFLRSIIPYTFDFKRISPKVQCGPKPRKQRYNFNFVHKVNPINYFKVKFKSVNFNLSTLASITE